MDYYISSYKRQRREEVMSYINESAKFLGMITGFGLIVLALVGFTS